MILLLNWIHDTPDEERQPFGKNHDQRFPILLFPYLVEDAMPQPKKSNSIGL